MSQDSERIERLEARLDAMSTLVKTVLTTLFMRGLLTKPVIEQILKESEAAFAGSHPAVTEELQSVRADLPGYIRAAMGPPPDDDDHDH